MHTSVTFFSLNRHLNVKQEPFQQIILPMRERLFRLAYGIVRDREEAEDILQDLLLKLWSRKEEWYSIENLKHIASGHKNMAFDRLSSMAVRKTYTIEMKRKIFIL